MEVKNRWEYKLTETGWKSKTDRSRSIKKGLELVEIWGYKNPTDLLTNFAIFDEYKSRGN